jgi:4-methyl-5(b-hydroxyethyl)-thiazole monophosphate biosynthesis
LIFIKNFYKPKSCKKLLYYPISDGFEEIEAISVIDILRRAALSVHIASIKDLKITGAHQLVIEANKKFNLQDALKYDAIVIPGGSVCAESLSNHEELNLLIKHFIEQKKLIAAICASPALVLGKNNFLENINATCYPSLKNYIKNFLDKPVVAFENFITAQGPASAIDFSLKIVEYLAGFDTSKKNCL